MMFILKMLLEVVIMLILCVILNLIFVKKILRVKNKKKLPLKKVKTVVFDVKKLKEDVAMPALKGKEKLSYYQILQGLNNLAEDKNIKKVIIDVDKLNLTLSQLEEISKIFDKIRKNKEVVAIGTLFEESRYRQALLADKIFMFDTRQSTMIFRGYLHKEFYLKSFLEKFGIRMNVLHIGDYKVAGEKYSHNRMSEEKRESIKNIKDKVFEDFVRLVKSKRGVDIENEILSGNLIFAGAKKVLEYKLIDGVADYDEIGINYKEDTVSIEDYIVMSKDKKEKAKDTIAVINLEGVIDVKNPNKNITYENVCEKLEELKEIKNLKGLVLRINSPGGSALVSEKIYKKIKKLTVPIYVSMGDVCASGGYYIATTGKKLFANNFTLTGSIGVVMMYPEVAGTMKKLDVNLEGFGKGTGFDMLNPFEKLGDDSREKLIYNMNEVYSEFKEHVMAARGMNEDELEKIAQGRVWLGSEAKNINLVDEIGTLEDCIKAMANDLKLDKYKVKIVELTQTLKETLADIKMPFVSEEIREKIEFLQGNMNQILYYESDFEL